MGKLIQLKDAIGQLLFPKQFYPVGWILQSYCNINPSNFCIGTWELTASGKVLIGIDTKQSEFDTIKKTGGSKYIQSHEHWVSGGNGGSGGNNVANVQTGSITDVTGIHIGKTTGVIIPNTNDAMKTGDSGNLQPYIVAYIWERIS